MILHIWDRLERTLAGLLAVAALLLSLWQLVGRYISRDLVISGGEELAVYLIIWAALISASGLVRDDRHVRADLVLRLLGPSTQRVIELFNATVAILYCGALTWYGWLVTQDSRDLGELSMTALAFPMWIYYAALPVSAALMTLRYVVRLGALIASPDALPDAAPHATREG